MSQAENLQVVQRWFEEVWNQRREATIDELLTPESVCYSEEGPIVGPAAFKARQYRPFLAAFSDLRVEVDEIVAYADRVFVRWTLIGHHTGDSLVKKATKAPVKLNGMTWCRVENGKMMEGWQCSNVPTALPHGAFVAPT